MSICRPLSLTAATSQPGASRVSRSFPMAALPELAPQRLGIGEVLLAQPFRLAEDVMLRHVRRVTARRRLAAERLGQRPDMVRAGAAADAEIVDAMLIGRLAELGDLEPVAGEGIERHRKGVVVGNAVTMPVVQRLEGRLLRRRAIGHGQRRDMALHRVADALQERQHGARPAAAIEADDVGAAILEALAGIY